MVAWMFWTNKSFRCASLQEYTRFNIHMIWPPIYLFSVWIANFCHSSHHSSCAWNLSEEGIIFIDFLITLTSFCYFQPDDKIGIGELALHPSIFGSSTTLLNANHYDIYFKGMPCHNGKVLLCLLLSLVICMVPAHLCFVTCSNSWSLSILLLMLIAYKFVCVCRYYEGTEMNLSVPLEDIFEHMGV